MDPVGGGGGGRFFARYLILYLDMVSFVLSFFSFDSGFKYCIFKCVHLLPVLIDSLRNLYIILRENELHLQATACLINFKNIKFWLQQLY